MKKILSSGIIAGLTLLAVSFGMLYLTIMIFPQIAEEYYNPIFRSDGGRNMLFYIHPFVLGFALAWFWERFKGQFSGNFLLRGLELGFVYAIVALLPAMWITFSAIDISLTMILTWWLYGLIQAAIAGVIFAKMNP
ncbi:MAG: hypothetical protein SFU99_02235 [Saprospiraceae bacterium]|nr:hypothetical protein [Saprospiraceae bacterium]